MRNVSSLVYFKTTKVKKSASSALLNQRGGGVRNSSFVSSRTSKGLSKYRVHGVC